MGVICEDALKLLWALKVWITLSAFLFVMPICVSNSIHLATSWFPNELIYGMFNIYIYIATMHEIHSDMVCMNIYALFILSLYFSWKWSFHLLRLCLFFSGNAQNCSSPDAVHKVRQQIIEHIDLWLSQCQDSAMSSSMWCLRNIHL